MNILRNFLIILLIAIVMLCAIIGLSVYYPDLFDRFSKKPEETSELAVIGETAATEEPVTEAVAEPLPEPEPEPEVEVTPSENSVSDDAADETNDAGLTQGISSSYIPGSAEQTVPDDLRSLTGYFEPHGSKNVYDQKKADETEATLSTGPTGDDLDFDKEFYPYYHMLDDKGKHLYRQIYANAKELNPDFKAVEKDIPWDALRNVFEALFNDHPELFWLNTEYSAGYRDNGDCLELILSFNRTAKDIDKSAKEFDQGATKVGQAATGDEYEQEKAVHDAICDDFKYNLSAEMNQSAYSGFVENSTVCAGYARAFQYIMTNLGIPCYYCRGVAGEPHAWNIIKLGDDYYNVDVTWDDSDSTWKYEYFNLSDDELSKDHRRTSLSVYLPACRGGKYSHLEQEPESENKPDESGSTDTASSEITKNDGPRPEGTYVNSLDEYFDQCYKTIKEKGKGSYSFDLYTSDKDVYNKCMSAYSGGSAKSGYMNEIFEATEGAKGFSVDFVGKEENGVYKMTQNVRLY